MNANILALAEFFKTHGWCKNATAQNAKGQNVAYDSKEAVSFCAMGAIERLSDNSEKSDDLYCEVKRRLGVSSLGIGWNDTLPNKEKLIAELERIAAMEE